jgi:Tfp pilus assembly protein PilN
MMRSICTDMSVPAITVAIMFESIELPGAETVHDLDDLELLDAMALATLVETAAIDVRLAAIQEIYRRGLRATAGSAPKPSSRRAALGSPRRRRRKARKRRRRH